MRIKVLLTGFDPFNCAKLNPSQEIIKAISNRSIDGVELFTALLPTIYHQSVSELQAHLVEISPDVVISLGQAEGRSAISLESVALNLNDARIGDNVGDQRSGLPIFANGPAIYSSTLPINEIVDAIKSKGISAEVSNSAGAFVCNHLFYSLQHQMAESNIKSGFIHVPLLPEQLVDFPGQPTMPLQEMVEAIVVAIEVSVRS